jgi:hypothetical protein
MIEINLYMHFLTIDEEQYSAIRDNQRIFSVYMSSVYFGNFIIDYLNLRKFFSIILYIMNIPVSTVSETQILNYVIKTTAMVRHMSLCFVVYMCLPLWQIQVWKKQFP